MKNISECFKMDYQVFLDDVKYKKNEIHQKESCDITMHCYDYLKSEVIEDEFIQLKFTRELVFEPIKLFELSVTIGANLFLVDEVKSEINLSKIDLAKELSSANSEILGNLVSRASLIISQLTATSFGNTPIITPPTMFRKEL